MLSISDFSAICYLSPQTLRFYHSDGLLVPADVNEQTGYRSYTFDQVEQAMLISVLRGAGMSVKLVRRALAEPDATPVLLEQHNREVQRQRQAQDEALSDAQEFVSSRPEVRQRRVPAMTVVSKPVRNPSAQCNQYNWDDADAAFTATVQEVVKSVEARGVVVSGAPWRASATEAPEQRRHNLTAEGPHWLAKIPITAYDEKAVGALPRDMEMQTFEARDELSILMPGRSSMAKYGTALSRLLTHPLGAAYLDLSSVRQLLHDEGVETAVAICKLDSTGVIEGPTDLQA